MHRVFGQSSGLKLASPKPRCLVLPSHLRQTVGYPNTKDDRRLFLIDWVWQQMSIFLTLLEKSNTVRFFLPGSSSPPGKDDHSEVLPVTLFLLCSLEPQSFRPAESDWRFGPVPQSGLTVLVLCAAGVVSSPVPPHSAYAGLEMVWMD
jgi:hypothetical protein